MRPLSSFTSVSVRSGGRAWPAGSGSQTPEHDRHRREKPSTVVVGSASVTRLLTTSPSHRRPPRAHLRVRLRSPTRLDLSTSHRPTTHPAPRAAAPAAGPGRAAPDAGAHRRSDRRRRRPRLHRAPQAGPLPPDEGARGRPRRCRCSSAGSTTTPRLGAEQDETLYIGRRHVTGEAGGEPMVIDWRAQMSLPFYRARPGEPMGVRLRRRFGFSPRPAHRVRGRGPRRGRRRRRAAVGDPRGRDRTAADRPDARHRGHHPARAGRDRPRRARRLGLRPGRTGHRQDRRRPAPRRLPAVRLP